MAVWNYRSGGTKTVITASTPDDWTLSNCFDSDTTAALTEWWRILKDHVADGDELVFYDEDTPGTVTTHNVEGGAVTTNGVAGTFTLRSRSGDKDQCVIRSSTAVVLVVHNNSIGGSNYIYKDITLAGSLVGDHTAANRVFLQASASCGDITFDNVSIGNCVLASATENLQGLIYNVNDARTVEFKNNCVIENVTTNNYHSGAWIAQMTTGTLLISGDLAIKNCTIETTTGLLRGGFYDAATVNITGDVTITDVDLSTSAAGAVGINSTFNLGGVTNITGSITADRVTSTGGSASNPILLVANTFNVNNITGRNITVAQTPGNNSVGGLFVATGVGAVGTVRNVLGEDINCFSGSTVYFSDGASGTAEGIISRRCHSGENGAIYSGGYGNTVFRGFLIDTCTSDDAGGGIYGHNHDTGGGSLVDKTMTLENGTIINCTGNLSGSNGIGDGDGVYIHNAGENLHTLDVTIDNVIVRCGGVDDVLLTESAAALNATFNTCDIENGATTGINDADVVIGTVTKTNILDDATQINTNGTLAKDSAYKSSGVSKTYGGKDANGKLLGLPTPIGGFGNSSCGADTRKPRV